MNIEYAETESTTSAPIQDDNISASDVSQDSSEEISISHENIVPVQGTLAWLLSARQQIKNRPDCIELRTDLINHMWEQEGSS